MNTSITMQTYAKTIFKSSVKQIRIVFYIVTNIILIPHIIIYFKNHRCVKMGQSTLLEEHRNIVVLYVCRLFFYTVLNFFHRL